MINKYGINRRTMKNDRRANGDVAGIIAEAPSLCVNMQKGANTISDIGELADGMIRAAIMDATVGGLANGAWDADGVTDTMPKPPSRR